ncbi:unnamed protein product [Allacma fusca]|uniref:Transposase n=1 Tax=Allacma fusca TaxID=39272 RepID=A0A8J2KEJ0_9HEXA|nr:unnamed protein product [Allacma fusca]
MFYSSMAKCSGFWNKVSRSTVIAEQLQLICGKAIQTPCPTRWNSLYDCITSLLVHKEKFEQIFEAAGISTPSREEIEFLEDYVTCMNPIATALDKLQGEERFLYGYFAPIIITTSKNLAKIIETFGPKRHVKIMVEILKARLEKRFPQVFQIDYNRSTFELLSSVCLPFFKLRWIPEIRKDAAKATFIAESKRFFTQQRVPQNTPNDDQVDGFFTFDKEFGSGIRTEETVELECLNYLQDTSDNLNRKFTAD